MFILTLVLPSVLLSAFAIRAVEAQRRVVLAERANRLEVEARESTIQLHESFVRPVRRAEAEVVSLAEGDLPELTRGLEAMVQRQPLLAGALVIGPKGRRRYPAQRAEPRTEPWPSDAAAALGGVTFALLPQNPGAMLVEALSLDPVAAVPALEEVYRWGGPATRLSALGELGRLQERYGRTPSVLQGPVFSSAAAEDTYARLAAYPVHATDLQGRLAAAQGRFRLALLRRASGDAEGADKVLRGLLDELERSSLLVPVDDLADLGERAAALLGDEARQLRARGLAEQRRQTEFLVERLERLFGEVLAAAARGERALTRISAPGLQAERSSGLSYVKARLGDEVELLTYSRLPRGGLVALRWNAAALQAADQELLNRSIGLERIVPWGEGLESDEAVGRARLVAPFDHLAVEVRSPSEQQTGVGGLPDEELQLWGIGLALVGIVMGAFLTIRTVRRESKEAQLKSDFVSNVTHELKTPLTSIRMFLETLILGRVDGPEEVEECLSIMDRETQRLTRLIEQLLVFSRIEGRKWRVRFSSEDPLTLVREAIKILADQLHTTPEELGIDVVAVQDLPKVPVDRFAVVEALLNLLHNAWKYSPNPDRRVRVHLTNRRRELEITVEDNGMGVPRGDRRRIFVKFERASNAEKSRVEGSGIGLTLASEIVKAHGGRIRYAPNKPRGSRFSVYLPR